LPANASQFTETSENDSVSESLVYGQLLYVNRAIDELLDEYVSKLMSSIKVPNTHLRRSFLVQSKVDWMPSASSDLNDRD